MCGRCSATFYNHNPSAPNIIQCDCAGCQNRHKEMLDTAARTAADIVFGMEKPGMAAINVCERKGCESLIKGRAVGGLTLALNNDDRIQPNERILRLELCPACVADIAAVLKHGPIGERKPAYSEPYREQSEADTTLSGVPTDQIVALLLERVMKEQPKQITGSAVPTQRDGE